jgi:hypothetical protein
MPFEEITTEEYIDSLMNTKDFGFTLVSDEDVLLQTIVNAEANGNYNAYNGNSYNNKYDITGK